MNISKFTQKSVEAIQNCEKVAGAFNLQSYYIRRQSDY